MQVESLQFLRPICVARLHLQNARVPSLELFTPPTADAHPLASRRVDAPGGTEWWHLDAYDAQQNLLIVADVVAGDPLDRRYRRAVEHFLRRPTRRLPPAPWDYSAVRVTIYRNSDVQASLAMALRADAFSASPKRLDVQAGPLTLRSVQHGLQVVILPTAKDSLPLNLTFQGRDVPAVQPERRIRPPWGGTFLGWVALPAGCAGGGSIQIGSSAAASNRFSGVAQLDYLFTDALVISQPPRWRRRRLHLAERSLAELHVDGQVNWRNVTDAEWPEVVRAGEAVALSAPSRISRSLMPITLAQMTGVEVTDAFG